MPTRPPTTASDTSSITSMVFSSLAETPQARKRSQHRQPLFEGEPDRGIDDEEADHERQQPECGQVEMKTVGQPLEIAFGVGRDALQLVAGDIFERFDPALGLADQQP